MLLLEPKGTWLSLQRHTIRDGGGGTQQALLVSVCVLEEDNIASHSNPFTLLPLHSSSQFHTRRGLLCCCLYKNRTDTLLLAVEQYAGAACTCALLLILC